MQKPNYYLALETAIGGGSVALFENAHLIDQLIGSSGQSRAEDLLPNIRGFLRHNDLTVSSVKEIVVGAGPGSFTGIRIGIATAAGLSASLGIPVRMISTLDAVAAISGDDLTVALPVGRDTVCVRSFSRAGGGTFGTSEPEASSHDELVKQIQGNASRKFVVYPSIFEGIPAEFRANAVNCGEDLARQLGQAAIGRLVTDLAAPMFIGKRK